MAPAASRPFYNLFFRKNYSMLALVFGAAFGFELVYNQGMDRLWDNLNRGRQWKDIRAKYVQEQSSGGDDDD